MKAVVKQLRSGSLLRAYHNSETYLIGSSLDAVRKPTFKFLQRNGIITGGIMLSSLCQSFILTSLGKTIEL